MTKLLLLASATIIATACTQAPEKVLDTTISDNIKFCESVYIKGDTLLIANFGGNQLNPLNTDGKGYIVASVNGKNSILIPADSTLSAPKGMIIHNNYLYVADVNKVVVYNLATEPYKGLVVPMPTDELFVNDIVLAPEGDKIYVTVTNTGNIYTISTLEPEELSKEDVLFYTNVEGANGIAIADGKMYIASYPADGNTTADNTIYVIDNLATPMAQHLIERPGQYDGMTVNDGKLYFSNWVNSEIGYIDLATKEVTLLDLTTIPGGPARIAVRDSVLFVPDLPNSRVIEHKLNKANK